MEFEMRVLLGVDGSTSSDRAAALVANLAWPVGSTIEVLTAYPGTAALFGMPGMVMAADVIQETEDAMEAEARRLVTHVARRFAAPDLAVETQVLRERAASAIIDEAETQNVDLIVLGNRGRGSFESAVLGSVCAEVVEQANRPVLVARRDRIARILVGEDGSSGAAAAAAIVRHWPMLHTAQIRVLSVADIDPQSNPWLQATALRDENHAGKTQLHEYHEKLAQETAAGLRSAGLKVEAEVQDGSPAHRLAEAAANWDADLIVVGHRGRSALQRLFVGSVARAILYHAPCSVLIVPEPKSAAGGGRG
jgi:nucleotide-binding universal stress UspA family protein